MDREDDADSSVYQSFLRSLNDESLLQHVQQVSQSNASFKVPSSENPPNGMSTPIRQSFSLQRSLSSDPFDDDLDEVLLNLGVDEAKQEAARNSDEDSTDEDIGKVHDFGDYATYFEHKRIKQRKADEEYVRWEKERRGDGIDVKPIFEGCRIHVNGHTVPSINEIHRIVIKHGGIFVSYLSNKGAATHIICNRLTPRKRIQFKNYKVVKAMWILDCVAQNRLLDWKSYRLIEEIEYGQKRLEIGEGLGGFGEEKQEPNNQPSIQQDSKTIATIEGDNHDRIEEHPTMEHPYEERDIFEEENGVENIDKLEGFEPQDQMMDANHPDFLRHFFAHSRLHHLSTWKADLRLRFLKRIVKENRTKPVATKRKLILHVDFDCFFATASCLRYPDLDIRKDPIAVTHGGKTSDVASCNYPARDFGVRNGMWLRKARTLCPQLKTLPYDFDAYEQISNEFYNYLLSHDEFDSIFPVSIDEALIDASSFCTDSGDDYVQKVNELASNIRKDILNLTKCPVSVGASCNVLLAKLSLKKAKPNNHFFLHDNFNEFLKNIRVQDLPGIGRSIEEKLVSELEKSNDEGPLIEDVLPLDKMRLMNILGQKTGAKLYDFVRGIDDTSITIDTSDSESVLGRKSISVDVNFGIRFDAVEKFEVFLTRLSKELYSRLISLGVCGSSITLRLAKRAQGAPVVPEKHLGMGLCDFVNKSSRLGVATNDWGIIGSEVKALYRMLNIPVKDLRGVSITMTKLEDVENLKKNRQTKLQFSKVAVADNRDELEKLDTLIVKKAISKKRPVQDEGRVQMPDVENIDWDVVESLPSEIRREIKQELQRRGLGPSRSKSASPVRKLGGKVVKSSLQQLIPSQLGAPPKYVRVFESSTRSPSKKQKTDIASPMKSKHEPVYEDDSASFSTTILNELPSSIRNEVMRDVEYKKKIKNFDMVPLRDKISAKLEESRPSISEISESWLNEQSKLNSMPFFFGKRTSYKDMKTNIDSWISQSLLQKGPHIDDVNVFLEYITSLKKNNNVNGSWLLVEHIKKALAYHEALNHTADSAEDRAFTAEGIKDWNRCLHSTIIPHI